MFEDIKINTTCKLDEDLSFAYAFQNGAIFKFKDRRGIEFIPKALPIRLEVMYNSDCVFTSDGEIFKCLNLKYVEIINNILNQGFKKFHEKVIDCTESEVSFWQHKKSIYAYKNFLKLLEK